VARLVICLNSRSMVFQFTINGQQLVATASLLAGSPLITLDEPTTLLFDIMRCRRTDGKKYPNRPSPSAQLEKWKDGKSGKKERWLGRSR
jgi:hypothetical protein